MFGADTPLVMDALQMVAVAVAITGGAFWLFTRKARADAKERSAGPEAKTNLEDRVRVLERIATDRSIDLAEEIEGLRSNEDKKERA